MREDKFELMAPSYIVEDSHWGADLDFFKDSISSLRTKSRCPNRFLDVGCGTGFHVIAMKRWYPELSAGGVDLSARMLREARKEIRRAKVNNVELIHSDILDLRIRRKYDLVSFLNNGLGNMREEEKVPAVLREGAVRKVRILLRKGGHLIISVYNLKKLPRRYGRNLRMLPCSDVRNGDLFVEYRPLESRRTETYYSHWFTENELVELLEQNGFEIDLFERRMARFVVRARAV